jgi:tetratricopeptide (TPR) repeat protein
MWPFDRRRSNRAPTARPRPPAIDAADESEHPGISTAPTVYPTGDNIEYVLLDEGASGPADAHNNQGVAHFQNRRYVLALSEFDKAIGANPNRAGFFANRGQVHLALNNHVRALEDLCAAIRLAPDDANGYFNRGNAYFDMREADRAIADYTVALERRPGHEKARLNRGLLYVRIERVDLATADLVELEKVRSRWASLLRDTLASVGGPPRA